MKSFKNALVWVLIGTVIMATAGYPLGIIPALVVLVCVVFHRVKSTVIKLRHQRPARPQSRDMWEMNAERLRLQAQQQARLTPWYEHTWYLLFGILACIFLAIAVCIFAEVEPFTKALTTLATLFTLRGVVFLRLQPR